MRHQNLPGLSPIWLIGLALCLGVFLATAIPLIVSVNTINSTAWIGFSGSVIGGAIAITGLFLASRNVRRQVRISLMGREEERMEAELPGLKQTAAFLMDISILNRSFSPGSISKTLDARIPPADGENWAFRLRKHLPDADIRSLQQLGVVIGQLHRDDYTLEGLSAYWQVRHERALREREAGMDSAEIDTALRIATDRMDRGVEQLRRQLADLGKFRDEINRRISLYEERLPRFRHEIEQFFDK